MTQKLQYLILLFCGLWCCGQVNIVADTDKKEASLNEKITLTIVQEAIGSEYVQESKLKLPDFSKFKTVGVGSDQKTFYEKGTNNLVNQIVYIVVLEPKVTGTLKIGSALVTFNGRIYKSEPFDITVNADSKEKPAARGEDVILNMEVENKSVYENQPTVAVIRAYSKNFNNLRNISKVVLPDQKDVDVKPVSFERSDIEQSPRQRMLAQTLAVVLLYPSKAGTVEVQPATAVYNNGETATQLKTNKINLNVKNLPGGSPDNFKNAVGHYDLAVYSSEQDRYEVNKPVNVIVKLSGSGNLNADDMPKIARSKQYIFYKPKLDSDLQNTENGLAGSMTANYIVVPKVAGPLSIHTENFSFFNPKSKKYVDLGSKSLLLDVMTPDEISADKSTLEKVNEYTNTVLETVSTPVIETEKLKIEPRSSFRWQTLVGNYSLIGLFFLLMLFIAWLLRRNFSAVPSAPTENVRDKEKILRESLGFDADSHLRYLHKLLESEDYSAFFDNFNEMYREADKFVNYKYQVGIKPFFETYHGPKSAEDFLALAQQLQIEKYSPIHTKSQLIALLQRAEVLYSCIK